MHDVWYALDFESSDQNKYSCLIDRVCVVSFNVKTGKLYGAWDFCFRGFEGRMEEYKKTKGGYILSCMMSSEQPKTAHLAGFELHLMEEEMCIPINGPLHCSYLMTKAWRNNLPAYDLKSLSYWLFGDLYTPLTRLREWIHKHNMKGEDDFEFDMTKCPDKLVHDYCMHDVKMTAKIASLLYKEVEDNYAYQLDVEVTRLNSKMEDKGIQADTAFYEDFIRLGKRRITRNTKQAAVSLGIDGGKRKPTGHALREHLEGLGEERRTPTGLVESNETVLRDHKGSEAVRAVQRIRKDQKQVSTYAENILKVVNEEGKFHPNLRQSAAITRRWRASNFYGDNGIIVKGNVQNFPRGAGIRSGIITPKGYGFVKFDLSSIEARVGANAMSVFLDFDYYCKKYTANDKFNIYQFVIENHTSHGKVSKKDPIYTAYKHACLGIQYGVGTKTFHRTLVDSFELPYTFDECSDIYTTIRRQCPEFSALQRAVSGLIESQGYVMDDFGAIYYVQEPYKGVNYYCQGCAGNVFRWWWIEVDKIMDPRDYLFLCLHDEVDGAIKRDRTARKRVKAYCDVTRGLDLFELPIIAEASGLVDNWAEAG